MDENAEGDDPNDRWILEFYKATQRLIDGGMSDHDAAITALEKLHDTLSSAGPDYAKSLEEHGLSYVAEAADYRSAFRERLRHHWGNPLDLYEVFVATIEQAATVFAKRNIGQSGNRDLLLDTLFQMNGQAIRVTREVHALLAAGYPLGALALARTVHEISVRGSILSQFGTEEDCNDLAEKFLRHDDVINFKDALVYQRDAGRLGYEPFDDAEVEEMRVRHDELVAQYGKAFRSAFGWASNLPGLPAEPNLEQMEEVAALDHHRGLYKWSSHLIHGDSKALRLSKVERAGRKVVLVRETNTMLADPAQHALISLHRMFVSMVTAADPFSFFDHLLCSALSGMLDKANNMFVDAEKAIDAAEERFQAELSERGLRFDPVLGEVPLERDADPEQQ